MECKCSSVWIDITAEHGVQASKYTEDKAYNDRMKLHSLNSASLSTSALARMHVTFTLEDTLALEGIV